MDINSFIKDHADLFEALAKQEEIDKLSLNQKERDALYHLLSNKDSIKKQLDSGQSSPAPGYQDIYKDHYKSHALDVLKEYITQYNLTPEEICSIITEDNINNILGKEYLCPPKESDIKK